MHNPHNVFSANELEYHVGSAQVQTLLLGQVKVCPQDSHRCFPFIMTSGIKKQNRY